MDIFKSQRPGLVKAINIAGGGVGMLSVTGAGTLTGMGSVVVTSFNVSLGVNNQYSPALDRNVYVYGFGDSIGKATVSGLTFSKNCGGGGDGLAEVISFYAGTRSISDVKMNVVFGGTAVSGFLDQAEIGADDPELRLGRFSLTASTLPSMMGF